MFPYFLIIGLIYAEIVSSHPTTEVVDNVGVCSKSSKACVVISKCANFDQLTRDNKTVDCGIDHETGDRKVYCPENSNRFVRVVQPAKDPYAIALEKCQEYSSATCVERVIPGNLPNEPDRIEYEQDCVLAEPLIVGGTAAKLKEFPHMAVIGFNKYPRMSVNNSQWLCGGSLISDRFVLTAAHCLKNGELEATWVRLGELVLKNDSDFARPKDFHIEERITHPDYRNSSLYNDIMLLRLRERVTFTPYMRPICLYTAPVLASALHNTAVITGWGATGADDQLSDILLKAKIHFSDECFKHYKGDSKLVNGFDPNTMLCAGNKLGNDTCSGDSGGPLQVPYEDWICMYSQVGITSYGPKICGRKHNDFIPTIYTKVSYYIPWIQSIVWP